MVREYGCYGEEGYMDIEKGGGWVKYEDYAELEAKVIASLGYLTRANCAMTANLQNAYVQAAIKELTK